MPLKLHRLDVSPPANSAIMVCDLLNVPIEIVDVSMFNKDHLKPEYLEKNPMHSIPMLEDGDLVIHDSHVIMTYVHEQYAKDDSLYPKDPKKRAQVDQKLYLDAELFTRFKNISYYAIYEGVRKPSEKNLDALREGIGFLEAFLSKTKFVAGDNLSLADISLVQTVAAIRHVIPVDAEKYPKIQNWLSYMQQQPYYQKIGAVGDAGLGKILKEYIDA